MLPMYIATIAQTAAGNAAVADAKRRQEQGLPMKEAPSLPPPTWKDNISDMAFFVVVLAPAIAISAMAGYMLYGVVKIAFAMHGMQFP